MATAVTAYKILSSQRRVEAIQWPADSSVNISQEHQDWLSLACITQGVLPFEYAKALQIFGLNSCQEVAPYTIKVTKTHVYKIWLREGIPVDSTLHPCFKLMGLRNERVWIGDGILVRYQSPREPLRAPQATYTQYNLCSPTEMDRNPEELAVEFLEQRANERRELYSYSVRTDNGLLSVHMEDGPHSCEVCQRPTKSKCNKCRSVYYCSKEHQQAHWHDHKTVCAGIVASNQAASSGPSTSGPSDSGPSTSGPSAHVCAVCQQPSKSRCSKCRSVYYCGKDHQTAHWPEHKSACIKR